MRIHISQTITKLENALDRKPLLFFLMFATSFSLIKSREFLPTGRFWAEEGVIFYPGICTQEFFSGLFFVFNNHLELFTNIGVYISTLVPFMFAPLISTLFSIIIWLTVFVFMFINRESLDVKKRHVYLIFLASMGVPQSSEVWANTINLHFVFLLLNAVILLSPAQGGKLAVFSAILVFFCGLSGIPANFIAPLYIVSAALEKNWGRSLQALAISLSCFIQLFLLYKSGYSNDRGISPSIDIIILASLTQSFWGLFLGGPGGRTAATVFGGLYTGNFVHILLGASFLFISLVAFFRVFLFNNIFDVSHRLGLRNVKLITAAGVCLIASITLALGDSQVLISKDSGGRYFWAPSMILLILFFSHHSKKRLHNFLTTSLFLFTLAGAFSNFNGPEWRLQFESNPL